MLTPLCRTIAPLVVAVFSAHLVACGLILGFEPAEDAPANGGGSPSEGGSDAENVVNHDGDGGGSNVLVGDASLGPCAPNPEVDEGAAWPLFGGCASHVGLSALAGPRATPVVKWSRVNAAAQDFGPPALTRDVIVIGTSGALGVVAYSFDGAPLWSAPVDNSCCGGIAVARSGNIFAGTGSTLSMLAPNGGFVREFIGGGEHDTAPVIAPNGNVYFGTLSNIDADGASTGAIYAVDTTASILRWKKELPSGVNGAPGVANDGRVLVPTENGTLYAFSATGTLDWSLDPGEGSLGQPVVVGPSTVYTIADSGVLLAIGLDGLKEWSFDTGGPAASSHRAPALRRDNVLYAPTTQGLAALRPDGTVLWRYDTQTAVVTSPVIDSEGTAFIVTAGRQVHAVTADGKARFAPATMAGTLAPVSIVVGEGRRLYVTTLGPSPIVQALGEP